MIERREREGPLMKNSPQSLLISRIITTVIIGVLTGCIIVFFFPKDFFVSQSITSNRHLPVAVPKTQSLILLLLQLVVHCGIVFDFTDLVDSNEFKHI
ncbi:transmembrane protein, putative [Medicago truncatula]|uniref:Transmembrane protein, putative n=1 Tax=Medicago truncatula TaxID=3880 RepID=A0A072UN06_MEDTR|nr:transmembrane protein, putative [Medicago truncatula]